MKVLVTGGTGFIGSNLAIYLAEQSNEVTICDNNYRGSFDEHIKTAIEKYNIKYIFCDMQDLNEFSKLEKDYDEIYHLAAINGTENFYNHPDLVLRVNILSTINLLDWVASNNMKSKLLFSSSSETYAGTRKIDIPTPETVELSIGDVYNPRFSYAGSKIVGELLFLNYASKYNLDVRIVRYHNIYGPRMGYEHVMPQFSVRAITKEEPFKIYGAQATRAFCYIDDAIRATSMVMRSPEAKNEIINIGNDEEEIKISDLAKMVISLAQYNPEVQHEPQPAGCTMRRCPDITKLKKITGFKPEIKLREGLQNLYFWYSKNMRK